MLLDSLNRRTEYLNQESRRLIALWTQTEKLLLDYDDPWLQGTESGSSQFPVSCNVTLVIQRAWCSENNYREVTTDELVHGTLHIR